MPIIITLVIAMLLILISWVWHNLGDIDKTKKIGIIIVSLTIIFLITLILFNISKQDIKYQIEAEMQSVRNVLVMVFTLINGLILMPAISKVLSKIYEKDIGKEQASRRLITIFAIFLIILIFECGYLKDIQQGILDISNGVLNK